MVLESHSLKSHSKTSILLISNSSGEWVCYLRSKRTQDEDSLREALRYSAAMLGELRTSLLTPQPYYELYMQATGELQLLEVCSPRVRVCVCVCVGHWQWAPNKIVAKDSRQRDSIPRPVPQSLYTFANLGGDDCTCNRICSTVVTLARFFQN